MRWQGGGTACCLYPALPITNQAHQSVQVAGSLTPVPALRRPPPLPLPRLQRACRRVSLDVFAHLLRLDHSFHLHRNTGEQGRAGSHCSLLSPNMRRVAGKPHPALPCPALPCLPPPHAPCVPTPPPGLLPLQAR